ncbi:MAG: rhomboid family intramembrane serine protease [Candidatus Diapherotrites archaeon]
MLCFVVFSFNFFFVIPDVVNSFAFSWSSPLNVFFHPLFHSGYEHLIFNVALIFLCGLVVERKIGFRHFLFLFFGGSFFSALMFVLFNPFDRIVGASGGAVSLLVSSFAIDFKKTFLFGLFFFFVCLLLVQTISYNINLSKLESKVYVESLKAKVIELESKNDPYVVVVKEEVSNRESFISKVEASEGFQFSAKPDLFVHFFGAVFGAFYCYLFLREFLLYGRFKVES